MSKNTTRRNFIQQSAGAAAAVLLASSSTLAVSPVTTLQADELAVAAEMLTEIKGSQKAGLLILVVEHFAALAQGADMESAANTIRERISDRANLETLRTRTRADLARAVADEAADLN